MGRAGTPRTSHTRSRASLTFAGGEAVGAGRAGVAPQPRHAGPAAALPAAGVAGGVQGTFRRAVAGCGRRGVGTRRLARACPPPPIPRGTLTGTGGEAVETGGALLAGGAGVTGTAAAQPARAAELVQGPVGVAVAGCGGHRVRPRLHGGAPAPPLRPRPAAHRGSWGSRGGPGGSGHSGGLRTRAGRGSGQPRRSPWAGSPHGCSHTLWGREAPRGAERGGRAPAHTPAPRPLGTPRSRWQRGKWK